MQKSEGLERCPSLAEGNWRNSPGRAKRRKIPIKVVYLLYGGSNSISFEQVVKKNIYKV